MPSTQIRCITTANRRATATIARFMPRFLAIFMPQALSHDHLMVRVSMSRDVFMGGKSSAAVRHPWLTRRSLANRLLSRLAPVQDLLLCAKHLFVAAMVD